MKTPSWLATYRRIRDDIRARMARQDADSARLDLLERTVADVSRRLDHYEQHGPLHYSRTRLNRGLK